MTYDEITTIIKKLCNNKAPDVDGIPNILLNDLPSKTLVQLIYIIISLFKIQYFPRAWKVSRYPYKKTGQGSPKLREL